MLFYDDCFRLFFQQQQQQLIFLLLSLSSFWFWFWFGRVEELLKEKIYQTITTTTTTKCNEDDDDNNNNNFDYENLINLCIHFSLKESSSSSSCLFQFIKQQLVQIAQISEDFRRFSPNEIKPGSNFRGSYSLRLKSSYHHFNFLPCSLSSKLFYLLFFALLPVDIYIALIIVNNLFNNNNN